MKRTNKISFFTILFITIFLAACTQVPGTTPALPTNQDIQYFSSAQELEAFIQEQTVDASSSAGTIASLSGSVAVAESVSAPMLAEQRAVADSASDFSTTNVQVEGIDEADIIKTDGAYLYLLSGDSLVISSKGPENARILSETVLAGRPQSIFLDNNKLVVFSQTSKEEMHWPEYSIIPQPIRRSTTTVFFFDISNPERPEKTDELVITGNYEQARLKDGTIYLIARESPSWWGPTPMPIIMHNDVAITPRIGHIGVYEDRYDYTTIARFSTAGENLLAESYLTGRQNTIYMSHDALYIAHRKSLPWRSQQREQFFDVVVPTLPQELQRTIRSIQREGLSDDDQWGSISQALSDYMNALSEQERERLYERIEEALFEHEQQVARERSKTIIHKFSLDTLEHLAQQEINGYLLNQFSLDEHDGYLRVATTIQAWTRQGREQDNNVYVLDDRLRLVGSLEGLAPDERIFSTRFIGERLYMVTFEEIDPFFVIDLADPYNPSVLGELKIPGWSDYLHPYDEHHIIGLGRQTTFSQSRGVQIEGIKLSLFNVEDVHNPREVATYEIGGRGSHSEALHDHRAFLFSKERELLVIPVTEMDNWRSTWEGAYVFSTSTQGFEREARIPHRATGEDWWSRTHSVRRALYIDDSLYTMSNQLLRVHSLQDFDEQSTIELPARTRNDFGRPMPIW